MRVIAILIALSLLLLAGAGLGVRYLAQSAEPLLCEAQAAAAALPDDPAAARAHLSAFAEQWARTERVWQFLTGHEGLEAIGQTLHEAQSALALPDPEAACLACARLPEDIRALLRRETPSWGNFF